MIYSQWKGCHLSERYDFTVFYIDSAILWKLLSQEPVSTSVIEGPNAAAISSPATYSMAVCENA